ncbi:M48 family metalloprotease, partial [Acidihalobacter prosperus]
LLIFAPYPAALAQLALSRVREYDADRLAVYLTGDPDGLSSAIQKLNRASDNWLSRILLPGSRHAPALLRTHPSSARRIARLAKYQSQPASFINRLDPMSDFSEGYEGQSSGSRRRRQFGRFRF